MTKEEWSVVFYQDARGGRPVLAFIESLDERTQARLQRAIVELRVRNVRATFPLVRHIEGKLWELREESQTNIYRLFYFFFRGRRIVLLHGFQKKSQKTPRREIETALRRMQEFVGNEGEAS
jgi:phage-related protein